MRTYLDLGSVEEYASGGACNSNFDYSASDVHDCAMHQSSTSNVATGTECTAMSEAAGARSLSVMHRTWERVARTVGAGGVASSLRVAVAEAAIVTSSDALSPR